MSVDTKETLATNIVTLNSMTNGAASLPPLIGNPRAACADDTLAQLARAIERQPLQDRNVYLGDGKASKRISWHRLVPVFGGLTAGLTVAAGYVYWNYAERFETTDDAFVEARPFSIAPKVAGYITDVAVTDSQHVMAGHLIAKAAQRTGRAPKGGARPARIDDRDFRAAFEQVEAQVSVAGANIQNIDAQAAIQQAQINASQAQVEQAQAALTFAEQQATRYHQLALSYAGTVQMEQQTVSTLRQAQAALSNARAALVVAQRQIQSLEAQRKAAEAALAQTKAQRDQAQLNLSYTTITAAQSGRIVNLSGAVGQYAQVGTSFSMFVPDYVWVIENFKEAKLEVTRPGQPVTMRIDAYPNRHILGHVDSVQPGSGTAFSLLPAQNATGNYVKLVQRVPVKIAMDNPSADVALGPGMSVVPSVRVEARPSLYERMKGWL